MQKFLEIKQQTSCKRTVHLFGKKILSLKFKWLKSYLPVNSKPKFCVSYSVFDGEELLEASIKSIRSQVDYINVVYQKISWRGSPCKETLLPFLESLKEENLIDELIFFEPDLLDNPQNNEVKKRNIGLKAAIKAGGNYFMTMDCDEFYFADELALAKEIILREKITHSYCAQIRYGNKPTLRQVTNHKCCYVQFFSRIDKFSILGNNELAICRTDPTRKILERKNSKHFVIDQIFMHHMCDVRKNLNNKYLESSRDFEINLDHLKNQKNFVEVENYFNIDAWVGN